MDTPVRRAMTAWRASKVETLRFNPLDPAGAGAAAAEAEAPAFSHDFGGALLLLANLREAGSTAGPATIVARREPRLCMMMTMRPLSADAFQTSNAEKEGDGRVRTMNAKQPCSPPISLRLLSGGVDSETEEAGGQM